MNLMKVLLINFALFYFLLITKHLLYKQIRKFSFMRQFFNFRFVTQSEINRSVQNN